MRKIVISLILVGVLALTGCAAEVEAVDTASESAASASEDQEQGDMEARENKVNSDGERPNATGDKPMMGDRENMDMDGEIVFPEGLSDSLTEAIKELPEQMQRMMLMQLPEEITEEVEAEMVAKIEMMGEMDPDELEGKMQGRDKEGAGHHKGGLSDEVFSTTERITLDGSVEYNNGTFVGVSDAYEEDLIVSVTIKDNTITEISITSHNETPGFYEEAFEQIPQLIVDSQSTDVDVVSGATASSQGIMLAVEEALTKAMK